MASVIKRKLKYAITLLHLGDFKSLWDALARRIKSEEIAIGFRRDIEIDIPKPRSLKKISVIEAREEDAKFFDDKRNDGLIEQFDTCYVAITKDQIPCARLWLIDHSQNGKLKKAWGDIFPELERNEMLIENVYTIPKFRGFGILPVMVDEVVRTKVEEGIRYAITFGELKNKLTTRSFAYAGFEPYILRRKKWILFKRTITFEKVPADVMESFDKLTAFYKRKR